MSDQLKPGMAEKLIDHVFLQDCPLCSCEMSILSRNQKKYAVHPVSDCILHEEHFELFPLDAWNSRPIEEAIQADNERLRDAMGDAAKRLEDVHPPSGIVEDVIGALNNLRKDLP